MAGYIDEFDNQKVVVTNPGSFIPKNIISVLKTGYNPPFYRNQLLCEAMTSLNMIDTASSGIRRIYNIQKEKYCPMPDYKLTTPNQVSVIITARPINDTFTKILYKNPGMSLEDVYYLDQIQKGEEISRDTATRLNSFGLTLKKPDLPQLGSELSKESASKEKVLSSTLSQPRDIILFQPEFPCQ